MMADDDATAQFDQLSAEAQRDSAPVAADRPYAPARRRWNTGGYCIGFAESTSFPTKLKWPRSKAAKAEFFERINAAREAMRKLTEGK
jgi:hypothetical protein